MKIRLGIAIILFFVIFSLIVPIIVPESELSTWDDLTHWHYNPKFAPPEWYNYLTLHDRAVPKVLTPETRVLRYSGVTIYNNTYVYEYNYDVPPQDVVILFGSNLSDNYVVDIFLHRPDGHTIRLYSNPINYPELFLGIDRSVRGQISWMAASYLNVTMDYFTNPVSLLFMGKDGNSLHGKYIFNVVIYSLSNSTPPTPTIRVMGGCFGLMGTDSRGRDLWIGFTWSMRNTLLIAFLSAGLLFIFVIFFGVISGYYSNPVGKTVDIMNKILLSIPLLPASLALIFLFSKQASGLGMSISTCTLAIILASLFWGRDARSLKMIILQELSQEYIEAARSLGAGDGHIIRKHILPRAVVVATSYISLAIPRLIVFITFIGFFGMIPGINWGSYMADAYIQGGFISGAWWWILPPGIAIALLALAFVLISRGVEEKFALLRTD
ncbi:ABC transporter permease [Thermococcus sp.]